jgi:hypothetical protein
MFLSRAADILQKTTTSILIGMTLFGTFNAISMIEYKMRKKELADKILEEETRLDE